MKNKFRILTSIIIVAGGTAAMYLVAEPTLERWEANEEKEDQAARQSQYQQNLKRLSAEPVVVDPAGDRMLVMAIARLEQRKSVAARLQHEAHLGGVRLDGKGEYLQQGRGDLRQLRWLLESQHAGQRASLLLSMHDRVMWIDRITASGRAIEQIDLWELRRLQKRQSQQLSTVGVRSIGVPTQLANNIGGLPMLLESLRANFEFTKPGVFRPPTQLQLGEQPVIGIVGRWRMSALASVLTDLSDLDDSAITAEILDDRLEQRLHDAPLPEWMPLQVMVLLGQQDLFPYLVEFRDDEEFVAVDSSQSLFQLSQEPLARLTMQNVTFNQPISTVEFIYQPPEEPDWDDGTNGYVKKLERAEAIQLAQDSSRHVASGRGAPRR